MKTFYQISKSTLGLSLLLLLLNGCGDGGGGGNSSGGPSSQTNQNNVPVSPSQASNNPVPLNPSSKISYHIYRTNPYNNGSVSVFDVDDNGVPVSMITNTGKTPTCVATDANNKFLYVVNQDSNSITQYSINPMNDKLTPLDVPAVPTGKAPAHMVIAPSGKYAYVTIRGENKIYTYTVNQDNGQLSYLPGGNISTGDGPGSITITANGKFVYAVNNLDSRNGNSISVYSVNSNNGLLNSVGTVKSGGRAPWQILISADDKYAYVTNFLSNNVAQFAINQDTGFLNALNPATDLTAKNPTALIIDPSGKYLFTANEGDDSVSEFKIDPTTGQLSILAPRISAGDDPFSLAIDSAGQNLYVLNADYKDSSITQFSIDKDSGNLKQIDSVNSAPAPIALIFGPNSNYAFVISQLNNIIAKYAVNQIDGNLLSPIAPSGDYPSNIAVTPSQKFAYVTNAGDDNVSIYKVDPTSGYLINSGSVKFHKSFVHIDFPKKIIVDKTGDNAYVLNSASGEIVIFDIDPDTGALTKKSIVKTQNDYPSSITIDPTGKYAYLAYLDTSDNLGVYSIDNNGLLHDIGTITNYPKRTVPRKLAIDPSGKFLYVTNWGLNGSVSEYAIDQTNGNLSPLPVPLVKIKQLANKVVISPDGKYAYATNSGDDDIFQFGIDADSGELSTLAQQPTVKTSIGVTDAIINQYTNYLYAVSDENNNIITYKIDDTNGMLMPPVGVDNMLATNDYDDDILSTIINKAINCHYYCLVTSKLGISYTTSGGK
ncbi:MAG: beta-propeller fold lactonase family protein [Burkholderiales bacterium]|jgi:6-phosphogluconolactonase (cycloisomerase 2 family)|nr:beta-propeller fold lactonase family protein [Burkholderiales bacterium]